MKRSLLVATLAIAAPLACAAADAPKQNTETAAKSASPGDAAAAPAADTAAARAQLAELRTQMQELSRKMARLSGELGDVGPRAYAYRYIANPDRGMIGVVLAKDERGQRVTAVTPGSPAARAGISNGDVIVEIRDDGQTKSGDAQKSVNAALRDLKVDQELTLVVLHDGKPADIKLRAERREPYNFADAFGGELGADGALPADFADRMRAAAEQARAQAALSASDRAQIRADADSARSEARRALKEQDQMRSEAQRAAHDAEREARRALGEQGQMRVEAQRAARDAEREAQRALGEQGRMRVEAQRAAREAEREARRAMPWWGLNLAPLNPELGRYFGTDHGALVISADNGSLPGLRGGDVITSVAGETVNRPEDALRALRDQPSDSSVPVKLMRDHKTLALSVKAPAFKSIFGVPPTPPEPPLPAAPPAPATPPTPPSPPTKPVVAPTAVQATVAVPTAPAAPAAVPPAPPLVDD